MSDETRRVVARPAMPASRMTRGQRWCLWLALVLCVLSGSAWLLAQYVFSVDAGFGPSPHPSAVWWLRAHGVSAYSLLTVVGSLWPLHMRLGWRSGRNRGSGLVMGITMLGLAATGLWLYYGPETGREQVAVLHWAWGLALPLLACLHRWLGAGRSVPGG